MNMRTGIPAMLLTLGLCCLIAPVLAENIQGTLYRSDIQPYTGAIGPDSSLYGLKLAFENLGDTFTFNQTQRLEREINQTDERLSELESALAANQTDAANRALDQYWQDLNRTQDTLSLFNDTGSIPAFNGTYDANSTLLWNYGIDNWSWNGPWPNNAVLIDAQQRILIHQDILEHLMDTHPRNGGLSRAYNASLVMEQWFENKTEVHFDLGHDRGHNVTFNTVILNHGARNNVTLMNFRNRSQAGPADTDAWQHTGQENPGHGNMNLFFSNTTENWTGNSNPGQENLEVQDKNRQETTGHPTPNVSPSDTRDDRNTGNNTRYDNENPGGNGNGNTRHTP